MTTRPHVNTLKAAMQGMKQTDAAPIRAAVVTLPVEPPTPVRAIAPSRQGKRQIGGHFDALVAKQLRLLAAERELSIQDLLEEALNDLFRKYDKSAVA
jgi:hypothetical protein